MSEMIANIYKITNSKTDDIYVGSTIQELKQRFKTHRSNANLNKQGKLYDCMRMNGIEHFKIELLEEINTQKKSDIGQKEREYYNLLRPSLNMIAPKTKIRDKKVGIIYRVKWTVDNSYFYIGFTTSPIDFRLCQHKAASRKGTTPLYKFMNEKGKDNFSIECLEEDIPLAELINREDYWIKQMNPSLNKNTNLTMTEKERDYLKYIKNREKRLKQVHERRLVKREEINQQKKEHYKKQSLELRHAITDPYETNPRFTYDILHQKNLLHLKMIAKRFSITSFPKLKETIIQSILQKQDIMFGKEST